MRDDLERGTDEIVENGNVHVSLVVGLEADQDLDHQGEDLTMTLSLIAIKLLFMYLFIYLLINKC
jgi:hypothetical protein